MKKCERVLIYEDDEIRINELPAAYEMELKDPDNPEKAWMTPNRNPLRFYVRKKPGDGSERYGEIVSTLRTRLEKGKLRRGAENIDGKEIGGYAVRRDDSGKLCLVSCFPESAVEKPEQSAVDDAVAVGPVENADAADVVPEKTTEIEDAVEREWLGNTDTEEAEDLLEKWVFGTVWTDKTRKVEGKLVAIMYGAAMPYRIMDENGICGEYVFISPSDRKDPQLVPYDFSDGNVRRSLLGTYVTTADGTMETMILAFQTIGGVWKCIAGNRRFDAHEAMDNLVFTETGKSVCQIIG